MAKQSLKQIAYSAIKKKILNCEYEPNSFLNEDLLCEQFAMSRTPIRDALSRMEQEGLLTIMPKKGFVIAPLTMNEVNMVFEGRLLIEPYIIANYCNNLPISILNQLYEMVAKISETSVSNLGDAFILDSDFHLLLVNRCTNKYILETYQNIHNQDYRIRVMSSRSNDMRLLDTMAEHLQVLDFLSKNDSLKAAEAMREHLINSKTASFKAFIEGSFPL